MQWFACYYTATVLSLLSLQVRHRVKSPFYVQTARNSELNNETNVHVLVLKRLTDNFRKQNLLIQ